MEYLMMITKKKKVEEMLNIPNSKIRVIKCDLLPID
jgi:hypothetical protein